MRAVRRLGLTLAFVCAAAPAVALGAPAHQARTAPCTAFGTSWAKRYNAAPGPIRIVSVCCALRSPKTGNSACKVKVTVRKGPGHGTFGCVIATVARNGDILGNRAQDCRRLTGMVTLPGG